MILIDTSVWIEHLRQGDKTLARLLNNNQALIHPFVIGEIACGNLAARDEVLSKLKGLSTLPSVTEAEVLYFIEHHQLMGLGIGYVDAHLLAATASATPVRLWTRDKRLKAVADTMGLSYEKKGS